MNIRKATKILAERYIDLIKPVENEHDNKHLYKMANSIIVNIDDWTIDKLSRWLGYIQYGVINNGLTTINKEREFSRPLFHSAYKNEKLKINSSLDCSV